MGGKKRKEANSRWQTTSGFFFCYLQLFEIGIRLIPTQRVGIVFIIKFY